VSAGRPDLDICECGDYLRDHDSRGCVLCRSAGNGTGGVIPACTGFRFSSHVSPADLAQQERLEAVLEADREFSI